MMNAGVRSGRGLTSILQCSWLKKLYAMKKALPDCTPVRKNVRLILLVSCEPCVKLKKFIIERFFNAFPAEKPEKTRFFAKNRKNEAIEVQFYHAKKLKFKKSARRFVLRFML